jgi:hypothetical protein
MTEAQERRARNFSLVLLAGQVAEKRFTRRKSRGAGDDDGKVADWALFISGDTKEAEAFSAWMSERCRNLVGRVWPQIEHVAEALNERGKLTGKQVRALMRETLQPTP